MFSDNIYFSFVLFLPNEINSDFFFFTQGGTYKRSRQNARAHVVALYFPDKKIIAG